MNEPTQDVTRIEIDGNFDAHTAEALRLAVQRLAREHGVPVKSLRIERVVPA